MTETHDVQMVHLYPLNKSGRKAVRKKGLPDDRPFRESPAMSGGDEWTKIGGGFHPAGEAFNLSEDQAFRIYESIWRNMDRENNLINQRISWAILLTAGFLTAQTFMLARVLEVLSAERSTALDEITYELLAGASFFCAILSFIACHFTWRTMQGVAAAQCQMMDLKRRYHRLKVGNGSLFEDAMRLPRPFGNSKTHKSGNIVAQQFPLTMALIWLLFGSAEIIGSILIHDLAAHPPQPAKKPPTVVICAKTVDPECRIVPEETPHRN